jgi:hypothetical protein
MKVLVPSGRIIPGMKMPATASRLGFGVTRARGRNPHFCRFESGGLGLYHSLGEKTRGDQAPHLRGAATVMFPDVGMSSSTELRFCGAACYRTSTSPVSSVPANVAGLPNKSN